MFLVGLIPKELTLCKIYHICRSAFKMENNEFQKVCIKNRTCYYFDDIIKFEGYDFDSILIDEDCSKMKQKYSHNIFHVIANVNSVVQDVIPIKNRIMIHANVSVKKPCLQKRLWLQS